MVNASKVKSLNQIKEFNSYNFIMYTCIFSLLSMAGIPPLLGFIGKFLSILYLNYKSQYFLLILTLIINMFSMYFYIQNLRFLIKKNKSSVLNFLNYYVNINITLSTIIFIFNVFNIFGVFFITDFIIIINSITSYMYIS